MSAIIDFIQGGHIMEFNTKLRFIVTSDIHYKMESDIEKARFEKGIKFAYDYAASHEYKNIDAFFAVGDFTNCGSEAEMLKFKDSLDRVIDKNTRITLMLASHEFHSDGGQQGAYNRLKTIFNQEADNYFEIGDCPFICISTEDGCSIKESKQNWLKKCLVDAASKDKKRPFFVFQHPHLSDTVYGSINWGDDDIIFILTDYPQVVDFSGHSHAPINDPRSIHQKYFTSLGTGSLSYFELDEFDFMYGTVPPDCKECAQYYIVEVSDKNSVRILPVDVLSNSFFNEGYVIKTPWEPDSFEFTASRALTEKKPYFSIESDITLDSIQNNVINISFPQAKTDGYRVNSYSVVIRNDFTNEIIAQKKITSSYYIFKMPESLSLEIPLDEIPEKISVEITAHGFWIVKSDKLIKKFTL